MKITSEVIVSQSAQDAYKYLSNPAYAPSWDRSIASVILPDSGKVAIGDKVTTIAPSGMQQTFTIKSLKPNHFIAFTLDTPTYFKSAELQFLIEPVSSGTRIRHVITMEFKFLYLFLYPVFKLTYKKALATDMHFLADGLDKFVRENQKA